MRAESPGVNQGSTFIVSLPAMPVDDVRQGLVGPNREASVAAFTDETLQRLDRIHVMLVEDDSDGRELISVVLEQAGATVTALMSVQDALARLPTFHPDVLISDIGLPDEDGYALIRQIREREVGEGGFLPAIALTGFARGVDRDRALAAGFQMHVVKPVDPAALTRIIAGLVVSHQR